MSVSIFNAALGFLVGLTVASSISLIFVVAIAAVIALLEAAVTALLAGDASTAWISGLSSLGTLEIGLTAGLLFRVSASWILPHIPALRDLPERRRVRRQGQRLG
jgi:hypothetical protein